MYLSINVPHHFTSLSYQSTKLVRVSILVATELCGGLHGLASANAVLTYVNKLELSGMGLTTGQEETALQQFPDHLKILYKNINSRPSDWDDSLFGRFQPLTLIRAKIPPSNRCASSGGNYHHPVIAFGATPQDQLGLRDPYRRIYFWRCVSCQSINGSLCFCRHLAALLVAVSFPYFYRSTSRGVSLLNTVQEDSQQVLYVLPDVDASSVPIPQQVQRRSNNTRTIIGGVLNPLYDRTVPASVGVPPSTTPSSTTPSSTPSSTATSTATSTAPTAPSTSLSTPPTTATPPPAQVTSPHPSPAYQPPPSPPARPPIPALQSVRVSVPTQFNQIVQMNRAQVQLVTSPLLRQYIAGLNLQQMVLRPLPPPSTVQLPNIANMFAANHLQYHGIINDGNSCCLLSFILCCHRMMLATHFPQTNQILQHTGQPDYASILFLEILQALPSRRAFSVKVYMPVWNSLHPRSPLGQNEDIMTLSELIISSLPLLPQSSIPVLTEYMAQYTCHLCGHSARNQRDWISKSFQKIPILNIDENNNMVSIGSLLSNLLATQFTVVCGSCGQHTLGRFQVVRGLFTLLRFNRIYMTVNQQPSMARTRLSTLRTPTVAEQYLGQLVSCVNHIGNAMGGHYVSYHSVRNHWYLNDDSNIIARVRYHPFQSNVQNESCVFVVYSNR